MNQRSSAEHAIRLGLLIQLPADDDAILELDFVADARHRFTVHTTIVERNEVVGRASSIR